MVTARSLILAVILLIFAGKNSVIAVEPDRPSPTFEQLLVKTQQILAEDAAYKPGDLIHRGTAAKILDGLARAGWMPPRRDEILNRVPGENDFLVAVLKEGNGRKLMRQIAKIEKGFDRLDRLGQLPQGQQLVKQLVNSKDGFKLIDYLTQTEGGKNLGNMLAQEGQKNFNQPTGKLYTAKAIMTELQPLYEKTAKPAQGTASN